MRERHPDTEELARRIAGAITDYFDELEPVEEPRQPAGYTTDTLAAELGITPRAVRAAIERGDLRAVKRAGRYFIAPDAVEAFVTPAVQVSTQRRRRSGRKGGALSTYLARTPGEGQGTLRSIGGGGAADTTRPLAPTERTDDAGED